jgi:hypothetical protein
MDTRPIRDPNAVCQMCNAKPAGPIRLISTAGRLIWSTTIRIDSNLCAPCAEFSYVNQQRRNLIQGWFAPRSAIKTPFYSIKNIFNIVTHRVEIKTYTLDGIVLKRYKSHAFKDPIIFIVTVGIPLLGLLLSFAAGG